MLFVGVCSRATIVIAYLVSDYCYLLFFALNFVYWDLRRFCCHMTPTLPKLPLCLISSLVLMVFTLLYRLSLLCQTRQVWLLVPRISLCRPAGVTTPTHLPPLVSTIQLWCPFLLYSRCLPTSAVHLVTISVLPLEVHQLVHLLLLVCYLRKSLQLRLTLSQLFAQRLSRQSFLLWYSVCSCIVFVWCKACKYDIMWSCYCKLVGALLRSFSPTFLRSLSQPNQGSNYDGYFIVAFLFLIECRIRSRSFNKFLGFHKLI